MSHTPGPWQTLQATRANGIERSHDYAIMTADMQLIAEAFEIIGFDERKNYRRAPVAANARLIATAPELLSALLLLVDSASLVAGQSSMGHLLTADIARARAALAKVFA